jgi:hypothetical protein
MVKANWKNLTNHIEIHLLSGHSFRTAVIGQCTVPYRDKTELLLPHQGEPLSRIFHQFVDRAQEPPFCMFGIQEGQDALSYLRSRVVLRN